MCAAFSIRKMKELSLMKKEVENGYPPVLVLKPKQVLISIYPKDFSFIAEENLSHIYTIFSKFPVKVNLMQNAAISFSVCVDETEKVNPMIDELKKTYEVRSNLHSNFSPSGIIPKVFYQIIPTTGKFCSNKKRETPFSSCCSLRPIEDDTARLLLRHFIKISSTNDKRCNNASFNLNG